MPEFIACASGGTELLVAPIPTAVTGKRRRASFALDFRPGAHSPSGLRDVTTGRGMDTIAARRGWRSTLDRLRCVTVSEAIMKAILSMALVLAASGPALAADE